MSPVCLSVRRSLRPRGLVLVSSECRRTYVVVIMIVAIAINNVLVVLEQIKPVSYTHLTLPTILRV